MMGDYSLRGCGRKWCQGVEVSRLPGCRCLGVRDERRAELLQGLLDLACALISCGIHQRYHPE